MSSKSSKFLSSNFFPQSGNPVSVLPIHLKGKINLLADQGSRRGPIATEWSLDNKSFLWCCQKLGVPQVDLFATRLNKKLPTFVSLCPDPEALGWDALEPM